MTCRYEGKRLGGFPYPAEQKDDKVSKPPAYHRVAQALRDEIAHGRWQQGDQLPSENDLVQLHGVSRNTVRQALELLASANLVQRHQGRGTFVATQGLSHVLGDLRSLTQVMRDRGLEPGILDAMVEVDHHAPIAAQEFLRSSRIWKVTRLRTGDGRPFCLMDSWVPDHIGRKLDQDELTQRQSLYSILTNEHGITLSEATETIRAEAASTRDATSLDVARRSPLLTVYRWTSDNRGLPVEYVRSASPGDRYEYVVKLQG